MALRRLAYERSYVLVVVGLWALGGLVYFCLETGPRSLARGDFLLPLLALPVVVLVLRRGLTGSRSRQQLWVDVPAGKVVLANGQEHALDSLGPLSIDRRYHKRTAQTQPLHSHELKAAAIEHSLFSSFFEGQTRKRLAALDAAIVQSAVRRLLESPEALAPHDTSELRSEVIARATTAERALAALRALQSGDHDPSLRQRASQLAAVFHASPGG